MTDEKKIPEITFVGNWLEPIDWKDEKLNRLQLKVLSKCFDLLEECGTMKCHWHYTDNKNVGVHVQDYNLGGDQSTDGLAIINAPEITKLHNDWNAPIVFTFKLFKNNPYKIKDDTKKDDTTHCEVDLFSWSTYPYWKDKKGIDIFRKTFEYIDKMVEREMEEVFDDDGKDLYWFWHE